ncbi:MAG: DNA mismatch endonuclease Vsr [Chlorobiaceae bacterium]|nr:DNA mismatch endonuclease Vsr [Chlorobiaceae bacterium]
MADVVSPETRSRMMSGIRAANTIPEMRIRRGLHARGFRFRLHCSSLPGKPDLVFSKYRAVIFVHGCFWHAHECALFKWPKTREEFWKGKIGKNRTRDYAVMDELARQGWRVLIVWECALKGKGRRPVDEVVDSCAAWLHSNSTKHEIRGQHEIIDIAIDHAKQGLPDDLREGPRSK